MDNQYNNYGNAGNNWIPNNNKNRKPLVIAGITVGILLIIVSIVICFVLLRVAKNAQENKTGDEIVEGIPVDVVSGAAGNNQDILYGDVLFEIEKEFNSSAQLIEYYYDKEYDEIHLEIAIRNDSEYDLDFMLITNSKSPVTIWNEVSSLISVKSGETKTTKYIVGIYDESSLASAGGFEFEVNISYNGIIDGDTSDYHWIELTDGYIKWDDSCKVCGVSIANKYGWCSFDDMIEGNVAK